MTRTLRKTAHEIEPAPVQDFADVVLASGAQIVVESAFGRRTVARAPSCLLDPQPGDRVLVVETEREGYVLAVVRRAGASSRLSVEGDLELSIQRGSFRLEAAEDVSLVSGRTMSTMTHALRMRAVDGEILLEKLAYVGRELAADVRVAKWVAGAVHGFVDRLHQHVKRSFRTVEESDQLRARRVDYRAEQELALHGRHAFVNATELVKVTGDQIHVG